MDLPIKKIYVPKNNIGKVVNGEYKFALGFRKLEGNCFEIDSEFPTYREEKGLAGLEHLKHSGYDRFDDIQSVVIQEIIDRLCTEHPDYFYALDSYSGTVLYCKLTNEQLIFDKDMNLRSGKYIDSLDAIASQVQEDIVVVSLDGDGDYASAVHVCLPSYFNPNEGIGKSFLEIHGPVPAMDDIKKKSEKVVETMVNEGPLVRYNYGFGTDTRLNHHNVKPGWFEGSESDWRGKNFREEGEIYFRVEKQVTIPLKEIKSSIFLIRPYVYSLSSLEKKDRERLASDLEAMDDKTLEYKRLKDGKKNIMRALLK